MVLAITLMMSTMDSFLNAMASIFLIHIKRVRSGISDRDLIRIAQVLILVCAGVTMLLAVQGFSVLYLFLVADLICAGALFPVFYGLFAGKSDSRAAFIASLAGIILGGMLFPDPAFSRGSLMWSFIIALSVPAVIVLLSGRAKRELKK